MSYRNNTYYRDLLITETFYLATHDKKLVKSHVQEQDVVCIWTQEEAVESYLKQASITYEQVHKMDIDRFVTYELDDLFSRGEKVVFNPSSSDSVETIDIFEMMNELMSDLDRIRMKEFVKDVAKYDEVFGLSKKGERQFILISDDTHEKPHIMPVWSIRNRAEKVRQEDFEECEIIEVEGEVFGEWLDELRDDGKAVGIDLKSGVVGTVVPAQRLSNELTF